jgi:hypothetical protein
MTTSADVVVMLAGAPVGAGIAVLGIALTNRHTLQAQRDLLAAQDDRDRAARDFDLRSEHLRQTLQERGRVYEALLGLCDRARYFSAWGSADPPPYDSGPLRSTDLTDFKRAVTTQAYRVQVHCSEALRREMAHFAGIVAKSGSETSTSDWRALGRRADALHDQVVQASVKDRTSGLVDDAAATL